MKRNVYSVAQVNHYIKNMFAQDFLLQALFVKGEVSNCKYHTSGHLYFTLKDEKGTLACVMFAGNRKGLGFRLQEGQQVIVAGTVDVYERDGKYQLYAREIMLDGAGYLYEKYEALKKRLEEEGLFAAVYKQAIPRFAKTVGIVTAPTGAAVRDIINIAGRRNPYVQLILYPAVVQGEQAPESIVNGIRALERLGVDVMIVGRGGGSIEDLWAFNEEIVAQAIFDCSVPVISAVGHETDTTIADFVADLRAPTPSAAAELAVCDILQLNGWLEGYQKELYQKMQRRLEEERALLERRKLRLSYISPVNQIREKRTRAMLLEEKLRGGMEQRLKQERHRISLYAERFKGVSPLEKLQQGFSYVSDEAGKTVTEIGKIQPGDRLFVHIKNGRITAEVLETEKWQIGKER